MTTLGDLSTAKLVALMGGSLSLESELGRGSCFSVELPLPAATAAATVTAALAPSADRLHVLLVEDTPVNQLVARRFLERAGHSVVVADDGVTAGWMVCVQADSARAVVRRDRARYFQASRQNCAPAMRVVR